MSLRRGRESMRQFGPLTRLAAELILLLFAACGSGSTQFAGSTSSDDPAAVYGICANCHDDIATSLTVNGGHGSLNLKCQSCHGDLNPVVGCGHQAIPRCQECHDPSQQITHHDPNLGAPQECTLCHTPHGSPNIKLIRTEVPISSPSDSSNTTVPCNADSDCEAGQLCATTNDQCGQTGGTQTGGCAAPIVFTNEMGQADGSFASVSRPGTGVCEVCHTTTRHYNNTGTGSSHFTFPCTTCHPHAASFAPQ